MKYLKMCLYGDPGIGKSVFALKLGQELEKYGCKAPLFITTDGNYDWLEDFGADPKACIRVESWDDAKKAFDNSFDNYDTIVVDLVEDLFKWCEYEFCKKNRITHISDMGYGKGYDITRNEFFIEISKLLNRPKHIILLSHEVAITYKDSRGIEHSMHKPSSRIPDKVFDMIEGRLRYLLRCYYKTEVVDDKTVNQVRMLSLVPKTDEYGIIRGVNTDKIVQDIPLDAKAFLNAIDFTRDAGDTPDVDEKKPDVVIKTEVKEKSSEERIAEIKAKIEKAKEEKVAKVKTEPVVEPKVETPKEEIEAEVVEPKVETPKEETEAEKLARMKARLAEMKLKKGN